MKLKCQCCGIEAEFEDGEAAYQAGWDCPPHFTQIVCCNLCPAVCILMNLSHKIAHELWEKEGRPEAFGDKCLPDRDWGRDLSEDRKKVEKLINFMKGELDKDDSV